MTTKEKQKAARKDAATNKVAAIENSKDMKIAITALEKISKMPDNILNMAREEDRAIALKALKEIADRALARIKAK